MFKIVRQTSSEKLAFTKRGYKLLNKIGEGSFSTVYFCEYKKNDYETATNLACKLIDLKLGTKLFINKFLPRELDILKCVQHPNIIHIQSILQRNSKFYIFMRFAERGDLSEFILKFGEICENQTRIWIKQIALALDYLHDLEIVHRDLKCENILITLNYNVKITDFGFSRYAIDDNKQFAYSETYCGSFLYAPPEVLRGNPYDAKISDMWSFGVILFTMLNKDMPFMEAHVKVIYKNQMNKNWKFRKSINEKLSIEIKQLVNELLEPNLQERLTIKTFLKSKWIEMDAKSASTKKSRKSLEKRKSKSLSNTTIKMKSSLKTSTTTDNSNASKKTVVIKANRKESINSSKNIINELYEEQKKVSFII